MIFESDSTVRYEMLIATKESKKNEWMQTIIPSEKP